MADNDIYDNEGRYERYLKRLETDLTLPPDERNSSYRDYYWIKNPKNVKYFLKLHGVFEMKDTSYQRRLRLFGELMMAAHVTSKDFRDCSREDMDDIVAFMHTRRRSVNSKRDFIQDIRYMWGTLFPEKDELGRIEGNIVPYPVRHLSPKIDRSKKRMRNDRMTWKDFERILDYFAKDPRMQTYIMLAMESLGRPQELLTRKIKHVEIHDCYGKIWLTEHGKEGPGLLQCIDSYPYLAKWLNLHPLKNDPEAWLFCNIGHAQTAKRGDQMKPKNVNKKLKMACADLGIKKRISAYSLKRNGVTFRRLRGDTDLEIQHAARWTSAQQLKTYDLSCQEDAMKRELLKRGIIQPENGDSVKDTQPKDCLYCKHRNGFTEDFCGVCKRPLTHDKVKEHIHTVEQMQKEILQLKQEQEDLRGAARLQALDYEAKGRGSYYPKSELRKMFSSWVVD